MPELKSLTNTVRFSTTVNKEFSKTLNERVNQYFKTKKIGKHANTEMVIKTIFMLSLLFIPYGVALYTSTVAVMYAMYVLMGVASAGIGLSIMHDASHGSYSQKPIVNKILAYTLNLVGGNATNWKIQHNILHHTFTNIDSYDEDIQQAGILRFSPHAKIKSMHKYQYIYAWFLYGLMTFSWVTLKDVVQLYKYTKSGMLKKHANVTKSWVWLFFTKSIYYFYMIAIPLAFSNFSIGPLMLGFFISHYTAGFILALIFQPAHLLEMNEFPLPDENNMVEENWFAHQLRTTTDFATNNKLLTWYCGGLNHQVEHHLFPNICHVHYNKLSKIVKETASEFGIPYNEVESFRSAIYYHGRMLYKLGRA